MMKLAWCFVFLLVLNSNPSEYFTYEDHPVLTWEDFKGVPPQNARHFASVNTGIAYSYEVKILKGDFHLSYEVESQFYPQLSWKKNIQESSRDLLAHEQLHWDISEIYARKLRTALSKYRPRKSYKTDLNEIFQKIESERRKLQKQYDRETNHGINKEEQARWYIKIKEQLFKTTHL
ncbi:DUF922 domain-containing protein [Nonlabens sp. MIC269]|uniref:DUF922 domain-containing protein n=1 Tax=Nonlabens sp. MIC269 TaxID=1476901 RepID=UPI000B0089C1|nr:DUF922 domain-containing protein [Nonlabens sp. MIC269]